MLTSEQLDQYLTAGFCIVPALLSEPETAHLRDQARADLRGQAAAGELMVKGDSAGKATLLKMWHEAGEDVYGLVARDERLVAIATQLIGEDTYLYSHKMTMKEPHEGGAWEWHQDFGYWYQNKCLAPQMLSIWIALDPSVAANGCLQVLPGSHALGRLDHVRVDGQTIVEGEYLDAALERFDLQFVEMKPGDALVFSCNLLHRSDANTSDDPRWGYIASYNAVANQPFRDVREYGRYQELKVVRAGALLDA
jgi:ectoine hydroxylase-related dioxygenase (phytanoyl-CoA dioxygenase family)